MNGFLRRLVERHADEPRLRPRRQARFEPDGVDDLAPESLERARVASRPNDPPPAARLVRVGPTADAVPEKVTVPPKRAQGFADATPVEAPPAPAPTATGRAAEPPGFDRPAAMGPFEQQREQSAARPATQPAAPARPTGHDALPPRRLPRPDAPAVSATRSWPGSSAATAGRHIQSREPDVVHVHIGRIEVRAVGAGDPEPRIPARRPTAAEPLGLDRYLSGERPR